MYNVSLLRIVCRLSFDERFYGTHVEPPGDFVGFRVGSDVALEVDVVALLDVGAVERFTQSQHGLRHVCKNVSSDENNNYRWRSL